MIVSFLNPKGGSGKTTLSINLARAFHDRGLKVLLVDSDPQGSASDWHAAREDNPVPLVAFGKPENLRGLPGIAAPYDVALIDGAAKLESMIAAAVKVSDLVVIPVQPSPFDIWAAGDLVELVKARQEVMNGRPKAVFVVSRAVKGTRLGQEVTAALAEFGLPMLEAGTVQRQVFPQTAADGLTVFDSGNADAKAEVAAIADELRGWMTKEGRA